jgi:methyltransferase-like protein
MKLNAVPIPNKTIVYQMVNDEAVLVLPGEGKVKVLNSVGAFIWQQVDSNKSVDEIIDLVVNDFEVDRQQAEKDTLNFLDELVEKAVIEK